MIGTLTWAAFVDPWGTTIVFGLIAIAIALAGRVRLSSPLVLAVVLGLALGLLYGGMQHQARYLIPLIGLSACFLLYMADILWSVGRVRKLLRPLPARTAEPSSAARPAVAADAGGEALTAYLSLDGDSGDQGLTGTGPRRVYYAQDEIVGAGSRLPPLTLTPALDKAVDPAKAITTFTASDLLKHLSLHLFTQGIADQDEFGHAYSPLSSDGPSPNSRASFHFTYGLPYMDVDTVVAVPVPRGRRLPFTKVRLVHLDHSSAPAAYFATAADRSPSQHPGRHYVRVTTASWDGQLVASAYISAALQGHYLRLIVRPYVLGPIAADLKVADELTDWHPLVQAAIAAGLTARYFFIGAKRLNSLTSRNDRASAKNQKSGVYSTRERYARLFTDMHQEEDVERIFSILELKIIRVAMDFLKSHNVDVAEYEKTITTHIQTNTIYGPGNIVTGSTVSNSTVSAGGTGQGNGTPGSANPGK